MNADWVPAGVALDRALRPSYSSAMTASSTPSAAVLRLATIALLATLVGYLAGQEFSAVHCDGHAARASAGSSIRARPLPRQATAPAAVVAPRVAATNGAPDRRMISLSELPDALRSASHKLASGDYAAMLELGESVATADISAALPVINRMFGDDRCRSLCSDLIGRWAANEPAAALQYVRQQQGTLNQSACERMVFEAWVSRDRAAALAYLAGLPAGAERIRATAFIAGPLARFNRQAAMAMALQIPAGPERDWAVSQVLAVVAGVDAKKAIELALRVEDARLQDLLCDQVVRAWAQRDLPGAIEGVLALPEGSRRNDFLHAISAQYARVYPYLFTGILANLPARHPCRRLFLREIAESWACHDPAAALAWAKSLADPDERKEAQRLVPEKAMNSLSWQDPEEALRQLEELPVGAVRDKAVGAISSALARRDPERAVQWIFSLPDDPVRSNAVAKLVSDFNFANTNASAQLLAKLTVATLRDECLANIAVHSAGADPQRALGQAAQVSESGCRAQVILRIVQQWAERDPPAAVAYAAALPSDQARNCLYGDIAGQWVTNDPGRAIAWAAHVPNTQHPYPLVAALRAWVRDAPETAADYAGTIPPGDLQTQAMIAVANVWPGLDPERSAKWVAQLGEGSVPAWACRQVAEAWSRNDPDAAKTWAMALPHGARRDAALCAVWQVLRKTDRAAAAEISRQIDDETTRQETVPAVDSPDPVVVDDPFARIDPFAQ